MDRPKQGYVCDRPWLLERLNTLLSTYEQSHDDAYAQQYKPLIDTGRLTLEVDHHILSQGNRVSCNCSVVGQRSDGTNLPNTLA